MGAQCVSPAVTTRQRSCPGESPITIVGSNKENIWLSVRLGQIAAAYISIFPKPLRWRQEHGPAKGRRERETAGMQSARPAGQGDAAGAAAEETRKAAALHRD